MAYNKAKEEKKWRLWKEAEEKQLRSLGVNEDDIEKLLPLVLHLKKYEKMCKAGMRDIFAHW